MLCVVLVIQTQHNGRKHVSCRCHFFMRRCGFKGGVEGRNISRLDDKMILSFSILDNSHNAAKAMQCNSDEKNDTIQAH